jgi:hypothetical protein
MRLVREHIVIDARLEPGRRIASTLGCRGTTIVR